MIYHDIHTCVLHTATICTIFISETRSDKQNAGAVVVLRELTQRGSPRARHPLRFHTLYFHASRPLRVAVMMYTAVTRGVIRIRIKDDRGC